MKYERAVLIAVAALFMCLPGRASAQFDHMTCFKVKDSTKFKALATLDAVQNAFDAGECKMTGKAALFCVPTDKTAVSEYTVGKDPGVLTPVGGGVQPNDTVCYKVKCPTATIADTTIVDQFGLRPMTKFKAQFLCGPAHKEAPTCVLPDPPQCPLNDPCNDGICSTTRVACTQQADCPLQPGEECCCNGTCL